MRCKNSIKISVQFLFLLFALSCCSAAFSQSTSTVTGTVTDQQGAVLPNARVVIHNRATGEERTVQTDTDGNYQIASLQPGTYALDVQVQGFESQVVDPLVLEVARTVVQNFRLTVGSVAQKVTITSDLPVIETATTSVGTVINQRTVQEIPLNGRHFVDLGLLLPGSVTPPQNGFLTAPLRGQGSFAFNTAGNREDTVNFQINGINLNDMVQNQITFQPSINTVQEFKADNSTFSAEYGRNSGAIVNIATRSGTNDFHGELFEFFRNDALDARNFFDAKKPPSSATSSASLSAVRCFCRTSARVVMLLATTAKTRLSSSSLTRDCDSDRVLLWSPMSSQMRNGRQQQTRLHNCYFP
jgi:hypothetical protein